MPPRSPRIAFLPLLLLLPLAVLTACGEEAAPPHTQTPPVAKPLSIVSTTPLIHALVRDLVGDAAQTHCLLRTPGELKHGDIAADATMLLRRTDVIFVHNVEPFSHVMQTVEAHAPADRIVRLGGSDASAAAFSVAPKAVVEMIGAIESRLRAADPANAATYQQRNEQLRSATMQFAQSMKSQIDAIPVERRIILTNDAQAAAVIHGLGLTAVTIDLPLTTHPTQADRAALLAAIRQGNVTALAIDAQQSETIQELLADVAKETGAKIVTPSLRHWPAEGENYVAWMKRNLEAVVGEVK